MEAVLQQQRNLHDSQLPNEEMSVLNKLQSQKRRAVFGDITNNTALSAVVGKKPCMDTVSEEVAAVTQIPDTVCVLDVEVELKVEPTADDKVADDMQVDWVDVDAENTNSPAFVSLYVNDIFAYYRQRETLFTVSDYMSRHRELSTSMRAILVDWLVEVQQNFELVHETLYMAVKLTDCYLDRVNSHVSKDRIQLIGSTALNIACKFEERSPPVVDDFLYVCDDAYTRDQLLEMEKSILKAVGFDIGMPLSYTFLRRYAQCGRVSTPTLTLARYILESSLMDYVYISYHESKMAAACLLLAMSMNNEGQWDATLTHYTGYVVSDLSAVATKLNTMLCTPRQKPLVTIKNKYSHPVFHEVGKIAALDSAEMELLCSCGSSGRKVIRRNT